MTDQNRIRTKRVLGHILLSPLYLIAAPILVPWLVLALAYHWANYPENKGWF